MNELVAHVCAKELRNMERKNNIPASVAPPCLVCQCVHVDDEKLLSTRKETINLALGMLALSVHDIPTTKDAWLGVCVHEDVKIISIVCTSTITMVPLDLSAAKKDMSSSLFALEYLHKTESLKKHQWFKCSTQNHVGMIWSFAFPNSILRRQWILQCQLLYPSSRLEMLVIHSHS
jgi:hypothetical protein